MNRLYTFLIISLLFTQSAWAFHNIDTATASQDASYSQINAQDEVIGDYDHCGHAGAHLVGLLASDTINTYIAAKNNNVFISRIMTTITYQPPVPPPTA